jgi:Fission yeast centromere protein N-terminal domain
LSSKKRRQAITNAEKIDIRHYYFDEAHNKRLTLKELQACYEDKRPRCSIALSSLSEITSSKYERLDDQNVATSVSYQNRIRDAAYPDLEAALYHFVKQCHVILGGPAANALGYCCSPPVDALP